MLKQVREYNNERLKLLKRAKLKQLESQLQYQNKHGANDKEVHQTMKDISKIKSEINKLS